MTSRQDPSSSEARGSSEDLVDLLAAISRSLIRAPDDQAEEAVEEILGLVGESLQVDWITVWLYDPEKSALDLLSAWRASGVDHVNPDLRSFPWVTQRLTQGKSVEFSDPEELPPEAAIDKASYLEMGVRAHYSYPLRLAEESLGVLAISVMRHRQDSSSLPTALRLISDLIVGAVSRSRMFSTRLQSDQRYRSFVSNSTEGMWCLEFGEPILLDGTEEEIIAEIYDRAHMVEANDAFARAYGYESAEEMGVWRLRERVPRNSASMEMIRTAVRSNFICRDLETRELDRHDNTLIILNNLDGQVEDGQLLRVWGTQRDVTESRQQETELRELNRQLTRTARLGTMGELSAAITHEIGQPLTAIATNAKAAQRFLAGPRPNLDEVSEILDDIVIDNQRAAAVSRNIRALVTAQETPRDALDIGLLAQSVIKILRSDATFRNIEIILDLEEDLPSVWCDGVQVQQVIINLVLNGCDAMEETRSDDRRIVLSIAREGSEEVGVSVRDFGLGFEGRPPGDLFRPFQTSKKTGLGMGLSISRRIVESHGGRIWGVENPDGGATFCFILPIASRSEDSGLERKSSS